MARRQFERRRSSSTPFVAVVALIATLIAPALPIAPAGQAVAATLPSGLQTGFALDGGKTAKTLPNQFDWDNFLTGVQPDGSHTFTPTPPYTTTQGLSSTGVIQGAFYWDNGSLNAACSGTAQDATGSPGSQTPDLIPWVPGPQNVNDKGNLCSSAYAVEVVTDAAGVRHAILYSYWTRRVGNGSVSVYSLFEGPAAGRCDDLLLEVVYPGGAANFQQWTPTSGDGCANPLGAGHWSASGRAIDFGFAMGQRTEGPIVANQQQETFGEYAIDLTAAGIFDDATCSTYSVSTTFSRTGNSATATIQDYFLNSPNPMQIANCGTLSVTKAIAPPGASDQDFAFTVRSDEGPIQPGPPAVDQIADTVGVGETKVYERVLAGPGNHLQEVNLPPPWQLASIVCTYLDASGVTRTVDVTDPATAFTIVGNGRTDCVITNDAALVTVTKQTDPDGATTDFAFDVNGQSVTLSDGESRSLAFPPGTAVTMTEGDAPGWLPPGITCTSASTSPDDHSATVTAVLGQNIECIFTNTQLGTVIITKEAHGVDGRVYSFESDIPGGEAFSIDVPLGDGTLYSQTIQNVPPGSYAVEEATDEGVPPTVLADLACTYGGQDHSADPAGRTIGLTVLPGETVRCFFTNTVTGSISVIKRTVPVEFDQQFDFLFTSPTDAPVPFVLNGNSDGAPAGALRSFLGLGEGSYSITEPADPPGWSLSALECNQDFGTPNADGRGVTVDLPSGGVVVCFFTNQAASAEASLTKTVTGAAAGLDWAFDVALSPGSAQQVSGTGSGDDTVVWGDLVPGQQYTISETAQEGWGMGAITCTDQTGAVADLDDVDLTFTFVAGVGQVLDCAMTNAALASSLDLVKVTSGIGPDYVWDFDMDIAPVPPGESSPKLVSGVGQISDGVSWANLVPGQTYTVTEGRLPDAVHQTIECDGSQITLVPGGFQFVAPLDAALGCTIVNIADPVTATITKTTDGADGAFAFVLDPIDDGDAAATTVRTTGGTGSGAFTNIVPGVRYSLTEVDHGGWDQQAIECTVTPEQGAPFPIPDVSDFSAPVGASIACSAHNVLVPGSIVFTKTTAGIAGDFPWSFPVTITMPGGEVDTQQVAGVGPASETVSWTDLDPGRYTLEEGGLAGWTAGPIDCGVPDADPAVPGVQIDLAQGDAFVCAATNTAESGHVTVVKRTAGIAGDVPWSFNVSIDPVPAGQTGTQTLSGTGPGIGSQTIEWSGLVAGGVYTLTESGADGWSGSFSCREGRLGDQLAFEGFQLVVLPGEDYACIADNAAAPATGSITKTAIGGDGTFDFVLDTVPPSTPQTVTATTTGGTGSAALPRLVAGQHYSLAESAAEGWRTTEPLSCTRTPIGGSPVGIADLADFTVEPADVIACAATNERTGTIVIVKAVDGEDGVFDFTGSWLDPPDFQIATTGGTGTETFSDVPAGDYTVSETGRDGYEGALLSCVDADADGGASSIAGLVGTIALDPGETVTCTYSNTQWGTLVVDKSTSPAGASRAFDFEWGLDGETPESFSLTDADEPFSSAPLAPGAYRVTELAADGWSLDAISCAGSSGEPAYDAAAAVVEVAPGDTVLCTFENGRVQQLRVEKTVTSGPVRRSDGDVEIGYRIDVVNLAGQPVAYDLEDRLAFGGGIEVVSAAVVAPVGVAVEADWDGIDQPVVARDATVPALETQVYTMTVVARVPASVTAAARECAGGSTPGTPGGFLNTVRVVVDGVTDDQAEACADAPPLPPMPATGFDALPFAASAVLLLLAGVGAFWLASGRRRRRSS